MYSTCLFCHASLGANEAIEAFPVGRRLAFDASKGRLWVVCRRCERWNLTPLEERWEAIEQCERAFRDTKLRVSTDEIGLARLREGLELVRIGAPQRPEMAAWRYGDQFGRRRQRALLAGAAAAATAGAVVVGGAMGVLSSGVAFTMLPSLLNLFQPHGGKEVVAHIPRSEGAALIVAGGEIGRAALVWGTFDRRWSLEVSHRFARPRWWEYSPAPQTTLLQGDDAVSAVRTLLPSINSRGARQGIVRNAVGILEERSAPYALLTRAAPSYAGRGRVRLAALPVAMRLAIEMATNEETEHRALEGELHVLEAAWRAAEEIAGIADDMFLPASVDEELKRLKRLSS